MTIRFESTGNTVPAPTGLGRSRSGPNRAGRLGGIGAAAFSLALMVAAVAMGMPVPAVASAAPAPAAPLTWSSQAMPAVQGALSEYNQSALDAVTCPTPTWCASTGFYDESVPVQGLFPVPPPEFPWAAVTVNGVSTGTALPLPAAASSASVGPPSCPTAGSCVAAGEWAGDTVGGPMIETLAGGSWTVTEPAGLGEMVINAIACPAPGVCMAVGSASPQNYEGMAATLSDGTWTVTDLERGSTTLTAVSCPAPSWCEAIGTILNNTLSATFADGTWSGQNYPATLPTNLACGAVGSCVAATGDQVDSYAQATGWAHPTTLGDSANLDAVSCVSGTSCEAVGYAPVGYTVPPVLVTWDGALWTPRSLTTLGGNGTLASVSCTADGSCTALGSLALFGSFDTTEISVSTSAAGTASGPVPGGPGNDAISCVTATACTALNATAVLTSTVPTQGYWAASDNGAVLNFGSANNLGMANGPLNKPVVGMARTADRGGYWLVAADGGIFTFGNARYSGSMGGRPLNRPIVGMAADPATGGYWLVAADGGIFSFDAPFSGSTGSMTLNRPIVGMAATPDGGGYWLVASDGGIFSFGDAAFHGSMGGQPLNRPVVGLAADPATGGYWLVASDGGIFSFDAPFFGSTGALTLAQPIVGMAASPDGAGYRFVAGDGGIFCFGDADFSGSGLPGQTAGAVVAMA